MISVRGLGARRIAGRPGGRSDPFGAARGPFPDILPRMVPDSPPIASRDDALEPLAAGRFPAAFRFGAATAAYQIEGAVREGGRGMSIWDRFSHAPGKVADGDTGDVACDHYHRLPADLDLLVELGLDDYRFSIAWPRVMPSGRGAVESRGLDFYERLVDGCLERGITPVATLYHWDLPDALDRAGGWRDRGTAEAFADYANVVVERLGDRVRRIATFNEPWCSAVLGHLVGVHAPGRTDLEETLAVIHHQNLAHGLGVQAMRASRSDLELGIVFNAHAAYPAEDTDASIAAAERFDAFHNGAFLGPVFDGAYPGAMVDALGDRMPEGFEGDLATIRQPLDWWGLNFYKPARIDAAPDAPWPHAAERDAPASVPRTDIGWEIEPASFTELLTRLDARHDLPPCFITENGACYNDGPGPDGRVRDAARIDYLDGHLAAVADAIDAGVDVRGYFVWSLMDNFEWAEGYRMRFGVVHVDYGTQARTVKDSGRWFRDFVRGARRPA